MAKGYSDLAMASALYPELFLLVTLLLHLQNVILLVCLDDCATHHTASLN